MKIIKIGIIGDYNPSSVTQVATDKALQDAALTLGIQVKSQWIPTESLLEPDNVKFLEQFDGVWGAPGDVRVLEGTIRGIQFAREHNIPYIGTCAGFQYAILEFARNVLNIKDATSAEFEPNAQSLVLTSLTCEIAGKHMIVNIQPNTIAHLLYSNSTTIEEHFCHFGINPAYRSVIEKAGLKITGFDQNNEPRIFELSNHKFFLASLFVPQTSSTPKQPHSLIKGFLLASLEA
ncbi:hypothetical protein WKK05_17950 [Nostoc sp. UHCC 0302]|uniref:CTP synthase C-terminal region-related (seleno)protein n=1 Tax=Nostoc sp. UHCC 0302 TaxID=3134896 RepID=UPI00311CB58E